MELAPELRLPTGFLSDQVLVSFHHVIELVFAGLLQHLLHFVQVRLSDAVFFGPAAFAVLVSSIVVASVARAMSERRSFGTSRKAAIEASASESSTRCWSVSVEVRPSPASEISGVSVIVVPTAATPRHSTAGSLRTKPSSCVESTSSPENSTASRA